MSEEEKQKIQNEMRLGELMPALLDYPALAKYFDVESEKMLDTKIRVLEELESGKKPNDIPDFYSIFELLPKEGIWD